MPQRQTFRSLPRMRNGFTMIELLAVMAIMGIMMGITVVAFMNFGRHAAMKGAVLNVRTSLSLARQYAITHRVKTKFEFGNTNNPMNVRTGWYSITATNTVVDPTNFLTEGVAFTDGTNDLPIGARPWIEFKLDGSCSGDVAPPTTNLFITEGHASGISLTSTTRVYKLTGRVKTMAWGEM